MKYSVTTQHPVAVDSLDHTHPGGTACDNSRNPAFNQKLFALFRPGRTIRLMDLGCSGGGFVKDVLDAGHQAIGIEGSDYSLNIARAEWATIPANLFTADITKPFQVRGEATFGLPNTPTEWQLSRPVEFDVITAWEVLEHLPEDRLDQFIANIKAHLAPEGRCIFSVSTQVGFHHVTVKNRDWWLKLFDAYGFVHKHEFVDYFGDDWIRGPNQNAPESFHLILERKSR